MRREQKSADKCLMRRVTGQDFSQRGT